MKALNKFKQMKTWQKAVVIVVVLFVLSAFVQTCSYAENVSNNQEQITVNTTQDEAQSSVEENIESTGEVPSIEPIEYSSEEAAIQAMSAAFEDDPSFMNVCKTFYAISPASIQSDVFAETLLDKEVTWSGRIVDNKSNPIIVATEYFTSKDGNSFTAKDWSPTSKYAPFAFTTRGNINEDGKLEVGDYVTVHGVIASRGVMGEINSIWRIEDCRLV